MYLFPFEKNNSTKKQLKFLLSFNVGFFFKDALGKLEYLKE